MSISDLDVAYFTSKFKALRTELDGDKRRLSLKLDQAKDKVNSLEAICASQNETILALRNKIMKMDIEASNKRYAKEDAEEANRRGEMKSDSSEEGECDCPGCQIERIIKEAKANGETEEPSEETRAKILAVKKGAVGFMLNKILGEIGNVESIHIVETVEEPKTKH